MRKRAMRKGMLRAVTPVRIGLLEEAAQATVEMVVVVPALLVLALIVFNLMRFAAATARFDRVAPDIVIAHGVSTVSYTHLTLPTN